MPKDARLGLVVGVGLVILIAVLFYRGENAARLPTGNLVTAGRSGYSVNASEVQATAMPGLPSPRVQLPASHTVSEGESLASIAYSYYGDSSRSSLLFRANRERLRAPDHVPVGTVLIIPDPTQNVSAGPNSH